MSLFDNYFDVRGHNRQQCSKNGGLKFSRFVQTKSKAVFRFTNEKDLGYCLKGNGVFRRGDRCLYTYSKLMSFGHQDITDSYIKLFKNFEASIRPILDKFSTLKGLSLDILTLKINDPLEVTYEDSTKTFIRHFAGLNDLGEVLVFKSGRTSFTNNGVKPNVTKSWRRFQGEQ